MADEERVCPECGGCRGEHRSGYLAGGVCPKAPPEWLRRQLAGCVARNKDLAAMWARARDNALMWHGKWAIVKIENNALRRKLARLTKREKAEIEE